MDVVGIAVLGCVGWTAALMAGDLLGASSPASNPRRRRSSPPPPARSYPSLRAALEAQGAAAKQDYDRIMERWDRVIDAKNDAKRAGKPSAALAKESARLEKLAEAALSRYLAIPIDVDDEGIQLSPAELRKIGDESVEQWTGKPKRKRRR